MTQLRSFASAAVASAVTAILLTAGGESAQAQCATCVTPTVAYSPVVVPATTTIVQPAAVRSGWYPGWLLDRWRMNRWSATAAPVATTVAPTYSASYAPATTYGASYAPYVASYAPLQTPVVQTSYMPLTAASYAPTTVYRPVAVTPVVQTAIVEPACSACAVADPCSAAVGASTVTTAGYVESSPLGCSSCAPVTTSGPSYSSTPSPASSSTIVGPPTGRPELPANEPTPATSQYKPETNGAQTPNGVTPGPVADEEEGPEAPRPEASGPEATPNTSDPTTFLDFQAPPLIGPQNDRTVNRPTVNIQNAVYSQPARAAAVSTTVAKPVASSGGWYSVEER